MTTSTEVKEQVKSSYSITYETALICRDVEKIMQGNTYNLTDFDSNAVKLTESIKIFQDNLIPLMTQSTKWQFPL